MNISLVRSQILQHFYGENKSSIFDQLLIYITEHNICNIFFDPL